MFNKNAKENNSANNRHESTASSINLIGNGTVIEGDIRSNGDIRIDGSVIGDVYSKAKVVIGNTGLIEGNINCQNADVSGTIKGKSSVNELLFLKASSKLNGDIVTGKLVVEVGATFTGSCNMGPLIKDIKDGEKPGDNSKEKTA